MEKGTLNATDVGNEIGNIIEMINANLLKRSTEFLYSHIKKTNEITQIRDIIAQGNIVQVHWCGSSACEDKIKEVSGGKSTNIPFDSSAGPDSICINCGNKAKFVVNFGRSY